MEPERCSYQEIGIRDLNLANSGGKKKKHLLPSSAALPPSASWIPEHLLSLLSVFL